MPETQKLSRGDRQSQLARMTLTAPGREEIARLYKQRAGIPQDAAAPPGVSVDEMIDAIIAAEYPK